VDQVRSILAHATATFRSLLLLAKYRIIESAPCQDFDAHKTGNKTQFTHHHDNVQIHVVAIVLGPAQALEKLGARPARSQLLDRRLALHEAGGRRRDRRPGGHRRLRIDRNGSGQQDRKGLTVVCG